MAHGCDWPDEACSTCERERYLLPPTINDLKDDDAPEAEADAPVYGDIGDHSRCPVDLCPYKAEYDRRVAASVALPLHHCGPFYPPDCLCH